MKEHLLLIGKGGILPDIIDKNYGKQIKTSVICRNTTLKKLSNDNKNEMIIGLPNNRPSNEWLEAARAIHKKLPITRIAAFGELDQDHAGYIAKEMNLLWHSQKTIKNVHNKLSMRHRLKECGLDDTPFKEICCKEDFFEFANSSKRPLIIKPVDGTASIGVCRISKNEDISKFLNQIDDTNILTSNKIMVEEMLQGPQFSVECFGENGSHTVIGTTRKYSDSNSFTELGHVSPGMNIKEQKSLGKYVVQVLNALGIKSGPTHTEVIMTNYGPRIIETHLRLAGDKIPQLIYDVTGIELEKITILQTLGKKNVLTNMLSTCQGKIPASAIWFIAPNIEGKLLKISGVEKVEKMPEIIEANLEVSSGNQLNLLQNSNNRIGWIRCHNSDSNSAIEVVKKAASEIEFLVSICNSTTKIETI